MKRARGFGRRLAWVRQADWCFLCRWRCKRWQRKHRSVSL